jgi:sortase (surface protein transpeptidase)
MRPRPTRPTRPQRRRHRAAALGLVGLALIAAAFVGRPSKGAQLDARTQDVRVLPVPKAPKTQAVVTQARARVKPPRPRQVRRVWRQLPPPVHLSIPAIGSSSRMIPLGRNADGTIQTPSNTVETGWFSPGPGPGELGAALVVGHVDSFRGPGVFFHLRALRRGDAINITLKNGHRLHFRVTGTKDVSKNRFPTNLVFAHTPVPTLRLVTCGGRFDSRTGHYLNNYIVFARLVGRP